jgi:hypothetical protein
MPRAPHEPLVKSLNSQLNSVTAQYRREIKELKVLLVVCLVELCCCVALRLRCVVLCFVVFCLIFVSSYVLLTCPVPYFFCKGK